MNNSINKIDDAFTGTFTSKGLMLAEHMGIFEHFDIDGKIEEKILRQIYVKKSSHIDAIITSLREGSIISIKNGICFLNVDIQEIKKKIPIFNLWIYSYRELLNFQRETFDEDLKTLPYDGESVAKYSSEIGSYIIDNKIDFIFNKINFSGTLCDMGCGAGLRLINICKKLKIKGIGMDRDTNAINLANKNTTKHNAKNVKFNRTDITKITDKYPEVEVIMFTFFTHHITPHKYLSHLLSEYKTIFPNVKYMIFFDTVTNEDKNNSSDIFTKGFDYIHRLQGLIPRTRGEYLSIFNNSNLSVIDEVKLELGNSYVWTCRVI